MNLTSHPDVQDKFKTYPDAMRDRLLSLRQMIVDTAESIENISALEETLKWGEPSYLTRHGSTIRMDWKPRSPDQYALYFNCQTTLIETFKTLYPEEFQFEGKRAIVFHEDDVIPMNALRHCISLSLTYHRVKHLPLLGA